MSEFFGAVLEWLAASGTLVAVAGAVVAALLKWTGLGGLLTTKQRAIVDRAAADGLEALAAAARVQVSATDGWARRREFQTVAEKAQQKFLHSVTALQTMFPGVSTDAIEDHVEAAWMALNGEKIGGPTAGS